MSYRRERTETADCHCGRVHGVLFGHVCTRGLSSNRPLQLWPVGGRILLWDRYSGNQPGYSLAPSVLTHRRGFLLMFISQRLLLLYTQQRFCQWSCKRFCCVYNTDMEKKRGRPFKAESDKMGVRIDIRLPREDKARYDLAAHKAHLKLSQWIRTRLDAAALNETKSDGRRGNRTRPEKSSP
jgi:hypothetical protein